MANLKTKKIPFNYNKLKYVLREKGYKKTKDEMKWYERVCNKSANNYKTIQQGSILPDDLVKMAKNLNIHVGWLRDDSFVKSKDERPDYGDYVIDSDGKVIPPFINKTLSNPLVANEVFALYREDFAKFQDWFSFSNILDYVNDANKAKNIDPLSKEEFDSFMETRIFELHDMTREYLGYYISENIDLWRKVRQIVNEHQSL